MKLPRLIWCRSSLFAASLLVCPFALADTVVTLGSITQIAGPGDLDLTGTIVYAINFSANDPEMTLNGVVFTPDTAAPAELTFVGPQNVTPWQTKPEFGDTPDDDTLEEIFHDIRWANTGAGEVLEAHLPVTANQTYKLQVLFYGNHDENRKWDIEIEDVQTVDEVTSLGLNEGGAPPWSPNTGLVYTATVTPADASLDLRFVGNIAGTPNEGGDRNPIWQALILEHTPATFVDTDGDGLPDTWEILNFTNLAQTATGDPDGEGLNNLGEFRANTDPKDADTDNDGLEDDVETNTGVFVSASNTGTNPTKADTDSDSLTDPAEINTHHTNPSRADSDSDGLKDGDEITTHQTNPLIWDSDTDCLSDSEEINTHQTNPRAADSDNDGFNDGIEALVSLTDPLVAGSKPDQPLLSGLVCGGDEGEGLDLKGDFVYAVNVGPNGPAGLIQDADFTDDAAPGVTVIAQHQIPNFSNFNFGTTVNDTRLKTVMDSIRWTEAGAVLVDLADIVPGTRYKLQLLFGEGCCPARGEDIIVEDVTVVHNFITAPAQGGAGNGRRGSVVTHEFVAGDDVLNISCDGPLADDPILTDHNAILSGVTLERLAAGGGGGTAFAITQVTKTGTSVTLNFRGAPSKSYAVDFSTGLATWAEVTDAAITTAAGTGSFTDTNAVRTGAALGHYRVRDPVLKPTP